MRKYFALILLFLMSCETSPKKGSTTTSEKEDSVELVVVDTSYTPLNLVKGYGVRAADSKPVVINLENRNLEYAKFDLADYFTKVRTVILESPTRKYTHIKDTTITIEYAGGGGAFVDGYAPNVMSDGEVFVVYDVSSGVHIFDRDGKFRDSIAGVTLEQFKYDKREQSYKVKYGQNSVEFFLLSVENGKVIYVITDYDTNEGKVCWLDAVKGRLTKILPYSPKQRRSIYGSVRAELNDSVHYKISPSRNKPNLPMIYFFNPKGDTIGLVMNMLKYPNLSKGGAYPGDMGNYDKFITNGKHLFRQRMSDTIFSIVSPDEIRAEYIINKGRYKETVDKELWGAGDDKLIISSVVDAPNFLYIKYGFGMDYSVGGSKVPLYAFLDKRTGLFKHIEVKGSGRTFIVDNSMPDALPFSENMLTVNSQGRIVVQYNRLSLDWIMAENSFKDLPQVKQQAIKDLSVKLGDDKIAMMVIE